MSDDPPNETSPWFVGFALAGSSALLMGAMVAVAALGLVWVAAGGAEGEALRTNKAAGAPIEDASRLER